MPDHFLPETDQLHFSTAGFANPGPTIELDASNRMDVVHKPTDALLRIQPFQEKVLSRIPGWFQ
jgi:hypothetical protein